MVKSATVYRTLHAVHPLRTYRGGAQAFQDIKLLENGTHLHLVACTFLCTALHGRDRVPRRESHPLLSATLPAEKLQELLALNVE
jgi:hypothetical protein